jgi:hypothetical protein
LDDFASQRFFCFYVGHFEDFGETTLAEHFAFGVLANGNFSVDFGDFFFDDDALFSGVDSKKNDIVKYEKN